MVLLPVEVQAPSSSLSHGGTSGSRGGPRAKGGPGGLQLYPKRYRSGSDRDKVTKGSGIRGVATGNGLQLLKRDELRELKGYYSYGGCYRCRHYNNNSRYRRDRRRDRRRRRMQKMRDRRRRRRFRRRWQRIRNNMNNNNNNNNMNNNRPTAAPANNNRRKLDAQPPWSG